MKKITLVLATMLLSVTYATAAKLTSDSNHTNKNSINNYRFAQPIMFVERGIEFLVFQNGEFDFNTDRSSGYSNNYKRKNRSRYGSNNSRYGSPGVRVDYKRTRGVYISHDRYGRVRRVGNIFVNYDAHGRVKRIGSVYMRYQHRKLKQVGGLRLQYNRRGGLMSIKGQVNYSNQGCGFCGTSGCSTSHFDNKWNERDDWQENDRDDYYYKKGNKSKKNRRSRSQ